MLVRVNLNVIRYIAHKTSISIIKFVCINIKCVWHNANFNCQEGIKRVWQNDVNETLSEKIGEPKMAHTHTRTHALTNAMHKSVKFVRFYFGKNDWFPLIRCFKSGQLFSLNTNKSVIKVKSRCLERETNAKSYWIVIFIELSNSIVS